MPKIFMDRMGNLHIWKNEDCHFERRGLHNAGSLCDKKEADEFIQFDTEYYMDNLESEMKQIGEEEKIDDLKNGYPITTEAGYNLFDLRAGERYHTAESRAILKRRGMKRHDRILDEDKPK